MTDCEWCGSPATKKVQITLSHPLSELKQVRFLCGYCYETLKERGVQIKEIP